MLLVALIAIALARPLLKEPPVSGRAVILLVDRSASMAATDVEPDRLEAAKRAAGDVISNLSDDDQVMVIAFSNRAEVVTPFTLDRTSASKEEVARFTSLAEEWWKPDGAFKVVHRFNDARLTYMRFLFMKCRAR